MEIEVQHGSVTKNIVSMSRFVQILFAYNLIKISLNRHLCTSLWCSF